MECVNYIPESICPEDPVFCTLDVKMCPDGTYLSREGPNCEFPECPICCDPSGKNQGFCWEGCACCPDGTWSGSIGDGGQKSTNFDFFIQFFG